MPSAAILAGGRATRFGGLDKSMLKVAGRPILAHQIEALAPIADDVLLVGREQSEHELTWTHARSILDRVPACGPLGALDAGLAAARHPILAVVACDMPFVTTAFIQYLLSLAADEPHVAAVVPRTADGYHPLCAVYTRSCQPAVMRRLAERRLAMKGLLDEVPVRVVSTEEIAGFGDPMRILANVNTPAALHGIEALQIHET